MKHAQTSGNGTRKRTLKTRVGEIELEIPKLRKDTYFPSILERRNMIEDALLTVGQEAYAQGIATRKLEKLFKALGLPGIGKSKVSWICKELNEMVQQLRDRPLQACYSYIWLDAISLKVRENHRVVNLSMAIATGVDQQGERHVGVLSSVLANLRHCCRHASRWLDFQEASREEV